MRTPIDYADIEWDESGQPRSRFFNDIYFSHSKNTTQPVNGLTESRYVFLHHNHLSERWLTMAPGSNFVIGETGFGTGLNFLATWQLWQRTTNANTDQDSSNQNNSNQDKHLHFVSVEKHPLRKGDLKKALAFWPELEAFSSQLIQQYPNFITRGFYSFEFPSANLSLILIIDDVETGLRQCLQSQHPNFKQPFGNGIDAWFLDGFAPKSNPHMWSLSVFETIGELSHPRTTLSTFTAAGEIQRQLSSLGFMVEKVAGFANKRDMITATRHTDVGALEIFETSSHSSPHPVPWSVNGSKGSNEKCPNKKNVVIIGAGLAGCHTAQVLANTGWQVTLLERESDIARGASGNAQGVVYGKLSADDDALAQFNHEALFVAQHVYGYWWAKDSNIGQASGVLQLAYNEREKQSWRRCQALLEKPNDGFDDSTLGFLSAEEASRIAGIKVNDCASYFPNLGWINPPVLCEHLLDHPNIAIKSDCNVNDIHWNEDEVLWTIVDQHSNPITSPYVIIANAQDAIRFSPTKELPLKTNRGQLTYLKSSDQIANINTVVCGEGYIAPALSKALQTIGATFDLHAQDLTVRESDHQQNLQQLLAIAPSLKTQVDGIAVELLEGRTALRCTSPDYLPLVGPVHKHQSFVEDYALLRVNAKARLHSPGQYWPGLYINVAHGSRGLAYSPLSARLLAAQLNHTPLPMSQSLAEALNPGRFAIRGLTRRKL